jgi:hypothetical protein
LRSYSVQEFIDVQFSSLAQLIGFTQGINRTLATCQIDDVENAKVIATDADTVLTAWCALLPAFKGRLLRDDGSVDDLLFKANILMHTQAIVSCGCLWTISDRCRYIVDIHRQLSNLKYFPVGSLSKCGAPLPPEFNDTIKDEAHIHTAKVFFAIEKLAGLFTLPTRLTEHTRFIICMITVTTIAHLSACRYVYNEP